MPLDYRKAARLIRNNGGRLVRHGSAHDIYETKDGVEIQLPRHRGDLTPGVERSIREKLGL